MINKKTVGIGIIIVLIIWSLLIPKANSDTILNLLAIAQNYTTMDTSSPPSGEQITNNAQAYDTAISKVNELKSKTSGRGNKAAINYTKNVFELQKKIHTNADKYVKVRDSKVHQSIIAYFINTYTSLGDEKVLRVEGDSILLWIYTKILL